MNILLIEDDESIRDIITYTILAKFKAEIIPASSYEEAINLIDKTKIDLVISDYYLGDKTGGDIYQYLLEINKYIPFAICSSIDVDEHQEFNDRKFFIGQIIKPFIFDGVNQVIKSYEIIHSSMGDLNLSDVTRENSSYSRINILLLSSIKKAQCKIYAQINDEKIVPVFEIDDEISSEKIEKVKAKGFEYLLIERSDAKIFFDLISSQIMDILKDESTAVEHRIVKAHERISDVAINLGFSEHLIKATEESVKLTLEVMKSNKELKKVYRKMFGPNESYLSSHSIALCYLSCSILRKTEWNKFEAKNKLVFASYFHDVGIDDQAFVENKDYEDMSESEKTVFENHVDRSVEFVRKFKEIPMDVDKIILQHHEDPTIEANKSIPQENLTPLSCIFIFSHKIVDILFDLEKENIDPNYDVVNERIHLDKYNSKNFEKVKEAYLKSELF